MMTDDQLEAIRARTNRHPADFTDFPGGDRQALLAEVDRLRAIVASPSGRISNDLVDRVNRAMEAGKIDRDSVIAEMVGATGGPTPIQTVRVRLEDGPWDGHTDEISPAAIVLGVWNKTTLDDAIGHHTLAAYQPTGRMGDDGLPIWACDAGESTGETWRDRKPQL